MKSQTKRLTALIILTFIFALCTFGAVAAFAEESSYYVCFSNQNYSVRNANKMKQTEDGYILENVSLSSAEKFYVTDNAGMRWYASDDEPMSVEEAGTYSYDIKFSPSQTFGEQDGWENTGCKITYRFRVPASYFVEINGESTELTYNPYNTAYDLYYVSSVKLSAGDKVAYGEEEHEIQADGNYRILFTPDKEREGKNYAFNDKGAYGSGDEYTYNLYIGDAPEYFAVLKDGVYLKQSAESEIDGKPAYPMARYENNVTNAEFRTPEFFVSERDFDVKYYIYEKTVGDTYKLIDDDNDEDTEYSKHRATDAGWYTLSLTEREGSYLSAINGEEKKLGGWYIVGEFNGYGFNNEGEADIDEKFRFAEVEEDDDDYAEDYKQFIAYITVTERDLRDGDVEFYITDGKTKYKNLNDYIALNREGKYKILFSEEHTYGRRNYRYVLEDGDKESTEITISTADEFIKLAQDCSAAEYSENLTVYLAKDIDFKDKDFVPVPVFSGKFLGQNHVLKNITYSDGVEYTSVFSVVTRTGVIDRLEVRNANLGGKDCDYVGVIGKNYGKISNVTVTGDFNGRNYVGGVAAYNGASVIDEDSATVDSNNVISKAEIKNCSANISVSGVQFVGGICGYNSGDVLSSVADGTVRGNKDKNSSTVINVGGIAGYSSGRITDCRNNAEVTGGADSLYVGGIAGICTGEIYFSFNNASVSGYKYVGGASGYYGTVQENQQDLNSFFNGMDYETFIKNYFGNDSGDTTEAQITGLINYCINYGAVRAESSYAGGIVGNSNATGLKIHNSASTGDISVKAGSYAGGIAGSFAGGEIKGCLSCGIIQAQGTGGGDYAGGIAGNGGNIYYCMSSASVKGEDFVGGIAGYASAEIVGCYANVLLNSAQDSVNAGAIAGFANAYNQSLNSFGGSVKGNYYVGANDGLRGIHGADYADGKFDYAAVEISSESLSSDGMISPYLCEHFSREYWQGGDGEKIYPTLYYFEKADECSEFDDKEQWNKLFAACVDSFKEVTRQSARLTYTVTFLEWNKDNGELLDGGEIQYGNFESIFTVRVFEGQTVEIPELVYAQKNSNGLYVYEGTQARYFVSFPESVEVNGNLTVYAEYREIVNSLTDENNTVFAEGDFYAGTQVELVRVGSYYTVKITLDGVEIFPESITVKILTDGDAEKYTVYKADGQEDIKTDSSVSGKYISFNYTGGQYFRLEEEDAPELAFWIWLLIGAGSAAAVAVIIGLIIFGVCKSKKKRANDKDSQIQPVQTVEMQATESDIAAVADTVAGLINGTDGQAETPVAGADGTGEQSEEGDGMFTVSSEIASYEAEETENTQKTQPDPKTNQTKSGDKKKK